MFFKYKDFNLYYEKYGNSKNTILILPGWGNNRSTFYNMINYLKDNYTIYIIDYPGFGNSLFPNRDLDIFDYTELIYKLIKYLNINNFNIIAHSFGGRIVSVLSSNYNLKINKTILIDTAGIKKKINIKVIIYKILKSFKKFLPNKLKYKYLKYLQNIFSSKDYKELNSNMYNTFKNIVNYDLLSYYKKINNKVLIIWGEKDKDTTVKDSYKLKKYIKNSELIIISKGSHFVYLNYPLLINKIIHEELKNI